MRLTTAKYYTPSHEVIHGRGIEPDYKVKMSREEEERLFLRRTPGGLKMVAEDRREAVENFIDPQLAKAMELLVGKKQLQAKAKPEEEKPEEKPEEKKKKPEPEKKKPEAKPKPEKKEKPAEKPEPKEEPKKESKPEKKAEPKPEPKPEPKARRQAEGRGQGQGQAGRQAGVISPPGQARLFPSHAAVGHRDVL